MALETATYIDGLVVTNPTSSDPKSQGDDHLRLIKSTIKNTFPNINGAVSASDEELSAIAGVLTASLVSSGYQKLPGGLIVQWGSFVTSASADSTITFPLAFPSTFFAAVVTCVNGGGSGNVVGAIGAVSTSAMNVSAYVGNTGARATATLYYVALGK